MRRPTVLRLIRFPACACGKTTLLELVLGFTPPTSGTVQIFGYDSYRLSGAAKARIGFVPQQDELIDQLTAADQIVSDVERLANKIWILKDGRRYWQGDFDSLKESIVRLHVRAARAFPETLPIPNLLTSNAAAPRRRLS